jgi:hypothetical protein
MQNLFLLILCCFPLLISCGNSSGGGQPTSSPLVDNQQSPSAIYQADLRTLNPEFSTASGRATFELNEDDLSVEVFMNGVHFTPHLQVLHTGSSCPAGSADSNGDAAIDSNEAQALSGQPLLQLDSDLNSRSAGRGYRPVGNYFYTETASWEKLLKDLWKDQSIPQDAKLSLRGRVVMIYGISTLSSIPNTVSRYGSYTSHDSLPIACGTLRFIR